MNSERPHVETRVGDVTAAPCVGWYCPDCGTGIYEATDGFKFCPVSECGWRRAAAAPYRELMIIRPNKEDT